MLQDRYKRTVSEWADSVVRLQRETVPRWNQLQRRVWMYQYHERRWQMQEER